jgi:hypothetical protein
VFGKEELEALAISVNSMITAVSGSGQSIDLVEQQDSSQCPHVAGIMYDLTGFQRDCLYTIAGLETPHGLAIKDELDNYYEKEIQHG